jgi:hypothetical protein
MCAQLLFLVIVNPSAVCRDMLLVHFSEPSILRFILTSDPVSVLADGVGMLLFREHWTIQLLKRCGQLGRISSREAPVFVFECWLNARDLPSLAKVERPGLTQVSKKVVLAIDVEVLVVHIVVIRLVWVSQWCSLFSSLAQV